MPYDTLVELKELYDEANFTFATDFLKGLMSQEGYEHDDANATIEQINSLLDA